MFDSDFSRLGNLAFSKGFGLHFKIDLCIYVGGIKRDMSQPGTDSVNVNTGTQQMYSGSMSDGVSADGLYR
jgi:hypothetical protein